jgi:hypothetical protein
MTLTEEKYGRNTVTKGSEFDPRDKYGSYFAADAKPA